jgi:PAS domain S-box-containing protein
VYYWGSLPVLSALLIAVLSSLLRLENFDKPFKAFLFTLAVSLFLLFAPVPVQPFRSILANGVGVIVIILSAYLILARKEISDLMFLFSMLCFVSGGLGLARGSGEEFVVFSYVFAYGFIGFVFLTSKESMGGGVASFFALKKELEKTREERERAEEKYRVLAENAPDIVFLMDPRDKEQLLGGKYTYVSPSCKEITGYSKKELISGIPSDKFIHSEDREKVVDALEKASRGESGQVEYRGIHKDGREIWLSTSWAPVRDSKGNLLYIEGIHHDITERKRSEQILRESEEKFKALAEQSPNMIFINQKGRVVYANKKCEDVMGYKKGELYSSSFDFFNIIAPESKSIVKSNFSKHLQGEDVTPYEYVLVTKEGKRIDAILTSKLIRYGEETAILGIVTDITERKNMEEALRDSEEKFRAISFSAHDAIILLDNEGKISYWNPAAEKIFGHTKEEAIGKEMSSLIAPKRFHEAHLEGFNKFRKTGLSQTIGTTIELPGVRKDGTEFLFEISLSSLQMKGKWHAIGILRNVTQRKQMEEKIKQYSQDLEKLVQKRTEELLESEKRYSVVVEEASDGVVLLKDEKIIFANKKAIEIFGYSKDETIGISLADFIEKLVDEKYRRLVKENYERRMQGKKVPATYEIELTAKNGERVPVELSATLVNYQGRPADLVIIRDIKERKRMEKERLRLERLATIGEVATMVGHDLRNPLQSIENAAYYLNNELPRLSHPLPIPQKTIKMLQIINNSVNYADRIVRDLQDFSVTRKPVLKETEINSIVEASLSQVEIPKNVKIIKELETIPEIKMDKGMIKRVFVNLATNAVQSMEKGGTLKVSTKKTKGFVEVSFEDTGAGMTKEKIKKIFTPFFTTKARGIGMGLPICKRFVESHGGHIVVESEEGKRSVFTVRLPIHHENGGENL